MTDKQLALNIIKSSDKQHTFELEQQVIELVRKNKYTEVYALLEITADNLTGETQTEKTKTI